MRTLVNFRLAKGMLFGAMLTLGACSFAPPYEQPQSPVPVQYFQPETTKDVVSDSSTVRLNWRDYFTSPQLRVLIEQALLDNRDLQVMTLRIREAQAIYGIERSNLYPDLTASAAAARMGMPREMSAPGAARTNTQYSVVALASWELDFWGRIRNLNEAALNNYLMSESAQQAASLSLVSQVATVYYSVVAIDEQLRITREAVETRQRTYNMFRRRHEVGSGTRLEVAEAETLLTQAQAIEAELMQQRYSRLNQLAMLTGNYLLLDGLEKQPKGTLQVPTLHVGLPSELLLYRPDIMAAESKLRAANANIGAARAAFFPSITLNGGVAGMSSIFEFI